MLVDELGGIVDLIVDHQVDVLLGVVRSNVLVREFGGHVGENLARRQAAAVIQRADELTEKDERRAVERRESEVRGRQVSTVKKQKQRRKEESGEESRPDVA